VKDSLDKLLALEPNNVHPMPLAISWDGEQWEVDFQVRTKEGMDIDGFARDINLERAAEKAYERVYKSKKMYEKVGYVPN
jgi:hypothetical protein